MLPGEAERKLIALEEEHEEVLHELKVYKDFYDASLALNIATSQAAEARAVRDAVTACETYKIRKDVDKNELLRKVHTGKHPRA